VSGLEDSDKSDCGVGCMLTGKLSGWTPNTKLAAGGFREARVQTIHIRRGCHLRRDKNAPDGF